jgi:hypothetical protein
MDDAEHLWPRLASSVQRDRGSQGAIPPASCGRPGLPGRHLLLVPVKSGPSGTLVLRTARLAGGQPVGLAFSSEAALVEALGAEQRWTYLSEPALRAMLLPLDIDQIRVDPHIAPAIHSPAA